MVKHPGNTTGNGASHLASNRAHHILRKAIHWRVAVTFALRLGGLRDRFFQCIKD